MQWHPVKPLCVSASSDQGIFHIWVTNVTERWSAYAAGFEELEENLEYQEREDEFDVEDEDEAKLRDRTKQEISVQVLDQPETDTMHLQTDLQSFISEFIASSLEWADEEGDGDNENDFFPPLDVDLSIFELDDSDIREGAVPEVQANRTGRR